MSNRNLLFFVFILLIGSQMILAQSFTLNGNGARAAGMGYAFTGIADDATAISWNAAGLTQLYSMEASVIGRVGFGSLSPNYPDIDYNIDTGSSFQLNFASFIVPFAVGKYNVVGGISFRNIYDFTNKEEHKATYMGSTLLDLTYDGSGGINAIAPAIAFQLNEMISFGAVINILTGSFDYESSNNLSGNSYDMNVDYSGSVFDLSVLLKPSPQFSIGANFNLPSTVTYDGNDSDDDEWKTEMDVPMFFSIGGAFRANDQLTLAFDYRSRPWSDREISKYTMNGIDYENPNELFSKYPDANSIHVGMEYLMESGDNFMPIRLGYYTLPTTDREVVLSGDDPEKADQISYNAITAGLGIIMEKVIIDGSFEYIFGSYVGDFYSGDPVDYDYSNFRVSVGATLHLGNN